VSPADPPSASGAASGVTLHGTADFSVYYEDTDFSGLVYHANYLKYFERGREELLGLRLVRRLYEEGLHFVVAGLTLDYLAAARHGDRLRVETTMTVTRAPTTEAAQTCWLVPSEDDAERAPKRLVAAQIRLVAVGASGTPRRVPEAALAALRERAEAAR
jgi:acyl-CoA thioester hydrolase